MNRDGANVGPHPATGRRPSVGAPSPSGSPDPGSGRAEISVVIPTLNEEAGLSACLASLAAAGLTDVVVVDGGSTDGTLAVADAVGVTVVPSAPGRARQQNLGAASTEGAVLLFLHADCRVPADLAGQLTAALASPGVVGGAVAHRIDSARRIFRVVAWGNNLRARLGRPFGDQALFVRRPVFERVGGFPDEPILEDVHLVRALRRAGRLAVVRGPVLTGARHWQRRGVLRQTLRNWRILGWDAFGVTPSEIVRRLRRGGR